MTKTIVIDLDDTLTDHQPDLPYSEQQPNLNVVGKLREYHRMGFRIAVHTARNMRSYACNLGLINAQTLPLIVEWLKKHDVPYDEIYVGKPWCGEGGFYVDDKAIRPDEFAQLSLSEITALIGKKVAI